jgi:hypothetical protein
MVCSTSQRDAQLATGSALEIEIGRLDVVPNFFAAAAHFLAELNAIHPIDLEKLDPDAVLDTMIRSFNGDEKPLAELLAALGER